MAACLKKSKRSNCCHLCRTWVHRGPGKPILFCAWTSTSSSKSLLLLLLFRHAPRAQFLMESAWLLYYIGDKAPPASRDSSEVEGVLTRRCYPHTGNGGRRWCLSSSLSLLVGFSIKDEAMDVARSAPQGAHYHADVIYLLP